MTSGTGYPCPECGARLRTKDSRRTHLGGTPAVYRRKVCSSCARLFTTYEIDALHLANMARIEASFPAALAGLRESLPAPLLRTGKHLAKLRDGSHAPADAVSD